MVLDRAWAADHDDVLLTADADAVGVPAAVAPRGAALGAHPLAAAVVLGVLLLEPLLQELQKLLHGLVREPGGPELLDGPLQVLGGVL